MTPSSILYTHAKNSGKPKVPFTIMQIVKKNVTTDYQEDCKTPRFLTLNPAIKIFQRYDIILKRSPLCPSKIMQETRNLHRLISRKMVKPHQFFDTS